MGSLEEEKLVEMVHDFIESEDNNSYSSESIRIPHDHHSNNTFPHQTNYFINLQEIMGRRTKNEDEINKRVMKHIMMMRRRNTDNNKKKKDIVTKLKMEYGYNASLCHSSCLTSSGCPAGEYEYIEIIINNEENEDPKTRVIVDIDFKSQFEVARPTESYKHLTDSLPLIFVGTEDKLIQIISILCSAAKQSLRERGLHVPPWRTTAYMHSKWLSTTNNNTNVITNTNSEWGTTS